MKCYEYEIIHTSENPILKNVDVSIVLAMKGTNRFIRDPFILNLSRKTIIQWNSGFKKCKKHSSIKKTCEDLNHAYETAFIYSKKYGNVIIFEDDAIVINKDLDIYKKIDKFIENENFNKNESILTFGSIARFKTYNNDFLKANGECTVSHGICYSNKARTILLSWINNKGYFGHIDSTFISKLDNIFTYKYPLIVQLIQESENSKTWWDPTLNGIINKFTYFFFIKMLKLDIKPDGWHYMYFINSDIGKVSICLIILLIILLFYKHILFVTNYIILYLT